jgi:glycosyltransferase involved in cell wall biosynthesis
MRNNKISLTAVVPVHNEELFLKESLDRLLKINIIDEIVVVDDCSTDNSLNILNELESQNKKLKVFQSNSNVGKGGAIKIGFDNISSEYVIIHDADLEYNPNDIYKLFERILPTKDNIILGTRFTSKSKHQIYRRTYFANKFLSLLFTILYSVKVTDLATCYKLIPSDFLKNTKFIENGFTIEVELLAKYLKINKKYCEVPISYVARSYEEGKKIKFSDGIKYIFAIFKYRLI